MAIRIGHASSNENKKSKGGNAGDQTGREIWTTSYKNYPWDYVLRYGSGGGSGGGGGTEGVYIVRWIAG